MKSRMPDARSPAMRAALANARISKLLDSPEAAERRARKAREESLNNQLPAALLRARRGF